MIKYTSFMKELIESFINYRKASQCWSDITYGQYLKTFENFCVRTFPNATQLTQEMIDTWCVVRPTELNKSYNSRIYVVIAFIRYTNSRGYTSLKEPLPATNTKNTYIPHSFTNEELINFFKACDEVNFKWSGKESKASIITIPVIFRLLYSSGIRTTEARLLKRENVDLYSGVISIENSKGYNQHYVVLHDSMKQLMVEYDKEISKLYPNRKIFFPGKNDNPHIKSWISYSFKKAWFKYNTSPAIAYDLRHNYAIHNINLWVNDGIEFNSKLYYLSKSMGHTSVEVTKRYYSLTPKIANIFKNKVNSSFENIIPEDFENE